MQNHTMTSDHHANLTALRDAVRKVGRAMEMRGALNGVSPTLPVRVVVYAGTEGQLTGVLRWLGADGWCELAIDGETGRHQWPCSVVTLA